MVQVLKDTFRSWKRRAEFWSVWMDKYYCDRPPLINFSFEMFTYVERPMQYYGTYDKDRWMKLHVEVIISRYKIYVEIPYRWLPDYQPTPRQLEHRARNDRPLK